MLQTSVYTKNEREISLSIWQGWLYKRLLVLPTLTLGLAELYVGRSVPHRHPNESVIHLVTEGRGHFETGDSRQRFEPGIIFCTHPNQEYAFDCDTPSIILTVRTLLIMYAYLTMSELLPGESSTDSRRQPLTTHTHNRPWTPDNECRFLLSGTLRLKTEDHVFIIERGTAFYIAPDTPYTLTNVDTQTANIAYAYADVRDADCYADTP